MSQKTPRKVSKAEVRRTIDDGIKQNDQIRTAGLGNLLNLRSKKLGLQQREKQRLSQKYDRSHSRVQQAENNFAANINAVSGLKMELKRATTPVKKMSDNAWAVQGHVYDRQGCPVANAEVALFDSKQERVNLVKATKTDSKGYYQTGFEKRTGKDTDRIPEGAEEAARPTAADEAARLKEEKEAELAAKEETGTDKVTTKARVQDGAASAEARIKRFSSGLSVNETSSRDQSVFVRAIDANDSEICSDSSLIIPRIGSCSYRDLVLNTTVFKEEEREKDPRATRYLGNSATRELHDLKNEKKQCTIDGIRFDHCVNFTTKRKATAAGYDLCAYCFGKDQSKR
jgi:hypothetical protein